MSFTPEQTGLLSAPLSRAVVKTRKMAGRDMSYVEGWHVIAEANRIFGFGGWTSETIILQETNRDLVELESDRGKYSQWRIGYIAKVRITAGGVSREGTGYGSGMGKPEAVGDAVEGAIKEAETDARKRALMTFGNPFGLALYDKEQNEVQDAKPAPSKPVAVVAESKPRMTPDQYADQQVAAINGFKTVHEATDWRERNAKAMVKLDNDNPTLYEMVMRALNQKEAALKGIAA